MKKWGIILGIAVILAFGLKGWSVYHGVQTKQEAIKRQAIVEAKQEGKIDEVVTVTNYRGTKAYTVIYGKNEHGEEQYVWIPQSEGETIVKPANEGLSREEVVRYARQKLNPKKIIAVRPGVEEQLPVWEIVFIDQNQRYTFYYLRFDGKDWVKNIHL
ncbi:MAG TPA: DUF5590 domain-containing protein [Bacillales bacterium]|nr:DUF5590 domain-containing protein [Bacillales bacterium]